jgi:hypothetical protein
MMENGVKQSKKDVLITYAAGAVVPLFLLLIIGLIYVYGSFASDASHIVNGQNEPYGFWSGYWHGLIVPWSAIWSSFREHVVVFSSNNSGWPYYLGFYIGTVKYQFFFLVIACSLFRCFKE